MLGAVHMRQGDLDKAMATLQKGHEIGRSIGWEQGVSSSICRMGIIKLVQGLNSEGEELLREAVAIARRSGGGWRLAQALHYLAWCYRHRDKLQDATLALEESFLIYQELAFAPDPGFAQETADLAGIMAAQGDTGGALTWYERAIALFREMQNKPCVSRYLAERGQVLLTVGRYDQGALHFEASMTIDRELGNDQGVKWNRNKISSIPKTPIEWEVRRRARLALAKVQTLRTTSLLCDLRKLLRRVPQLTTPHLKLQVKLVDKRDS